MAAGQADAERERRRGRGPLPQANQGLPQHQGHALQRRGPLVQARLIKQEEGGTITDGGPRKEEGQKGMLGRPWGHAPSPSSRPSSSRSLFPHFSFSGSPFLSLRAILINRPPSLRFLSPTIEEHGQQHQHDDEPAALSLYYLPLPFSLGGATVLLANGGLLSGSAAITALFVPGSRLAASSLFSLPPFPFVPWPSFPSSFSHLAFLLLLYLLALHALALLEERGRQEQRRGRGRLRG